MYRIYLPLLVLALVFISATRAESNTQQPQGTYECDRCIVNTH